jgi:hypothetical protein
MAHVGHPVLGDAEYGGVTEASPIEVQRQMLHAAKLSVGPAHVDIPVPEDFEAAIAALGESDD